jgi:hypothetical protein
MLKDWYIRYANTSGVSALAGKLTYYILGVSGRTDPSKACRLYLYYSNPNCDPSLDQRTDINYPHCLDYEIEINPAPLIQAGCTNFADAIKDIVDVAEKIINDPSKVSKYSWGYQLSPQEFSVPGTELGMKSCDPTGPDYAMLGSSMGYIQNHIASGDRYESVLKVDTIKLLEDAQTYMDYEGARIAQYKKEEQNKSRRTSTFLKKLDVLTPRNMIREVNARLKRQSWNILELMELLIEEAESAGMQNISNTFQDLMDSSNWLTSDDKPVYDVLDDAFQHTYYDNGKPLSGYNDPNDPKVWHDYFEHYDRDQDYGDFFSGDRVVSVDYSVHHGNELKVYFEFSSKDLIKYVQDEYGGAEYDHDFR